MKRFILKVDGIFLAGMGMLAGIADLASYYGGKGPFGQTYFQNSIIIGGFEAHCLAVILGLILILRSKSPEGLFYNKVAIGIHCVLGISNLVWFRVFYDTGMLSMGFIATALHFNMVFFNMIAISKNWKSALAGNPKNVQI